MTQQTNEGIAMNAHTSTLPARGEFVERIKSLWHKSREMVLALGRALLDAKEALPHGEFTNMIRDDLPFSPETAQHFMRIVRDPRLWDPVTLPVLPPGLHALDEIRKLPTDELEGAIEAGVIHPKMTVEDARALVKPRPIIHTETRPPADLKLPIIGARDLIATMKGYRAVEGLSQLEADYRAGTQDGYIGKLELGMKQPFPNGAIPDGSVPSQSWWWWMGAYNLVMLLVPAADACQPGKCPCCGREN